MKVVVFLSILLCVYAQSPTPTPTATPTPLVTPTPPITTQPDVPPECVPGSTVPRPPNVVCPTVGGVSGVIAVSSFRSCSYYQPNLDCGDNQNVTVLSLGINPGTGNDVQYTFTTVPNPNSGEQNNYAGNQCTGGTCSAVTEQISLTVKASQLVVYYELAPINLEVPFAYASFFTPAFGHYTQDPPNTCGGVANVVSNFNSLNTSTNTPSQSLGIQFSQICQFVVGNTKNCGDLQFQDGNPNWPWVNSCSDDANDMGGGWPKVVENISDQTTNYFGSDKVARQVLCDMPAPSTACVNMPPGTENPVFGMVTPPMGSAWNVPYSFNGDTNAENDANVDDTSNPHTVRTGPCKRSEVDDDADDDSTTQCMRKYSRLTTNSVCRQWFGNWFYMGKAPRWKMNPNQVMARFCQSDDPTTGPGVDAYGGVSSVRPVLPGCGGAGTLGGGSVLPPFFPWGLSPTTFRGGNPNNIIGPYSPRTGDTGNVCGPNDDDCCEASILTEDTGGIPFIKCAPGVDKAEKGGANQYCPAGVNPQMCPICAPERAGLVTGDGSTHYTANAIGKMFPMCGVYQVRPAPNPVFTINATITQGSPTGPQVDFVNITNVVFAQNCVQGSSSDRSQCYQQTSSPLIGQVATSANHSMLIEIIGIDSTTGAISSELNGYIVVCNQTGSGLGIFMGDSNDITINPWVNILKNNGIGIRNQNGDRVAFAPWPELLGLDPTVENNKGVWFYYVPDYKVQNYGTGCGEMGMQNRFYGNALNAEFLCKECHNKCVPGFQECEDWTLQDRITDFKNNGSTTERLIRDAMPVHTPCQISGYYHEWMETSATCQDFINAYRKFGYLPTNWVDESGVGGDGISCGPPLYSINGNKLIYFDPTLASNNLYVRLKVTVKGELYSVQQDISSGCFSQPVIVPNQKYCLDEVTTIAPGDIKCGVIQNSNDGGLTMFVANTGDLPGDYAIIVQCSQGSGITQDGAPVFEIDPNTQPVQVTVPLRHSGVIPTNVTCMVNLTHPVYNIIFDSLITSACAVVSSSSELPVISYNASNACLLYQIDCPVPQEQPTTSVAWGFISFIFAFCLMFIGICCIASLRNSIKTIDARINTTKSLKPVTKAIVKNKE